MKTPEQLKGVLRNMANSKGIRADALLQIFLFERIIERLSKSKFADNFVLKGGLLISSIIGIDRRTTMDMDTTVHGLPVNEGYMTNVLNEILIVPIEDGVSFSLQSIKPIREQDVYENFCATIIADYGRIHATLKMDITTGDAITPAEVIYEYPFLFDTMTVNVVAYPLETIIAEKLETVLSRNVSTTRARDLYDLTILCRLKSSEINLKTLKAAIRNTVNKRGSAKYLDQIQDIYDLMKDDSGQNKMWAQYQKANSFAEDISYGQALASILEVGKMAGLI